MPPEVELFWAGAILILIAALLPMRHPAERFFLVVGIFLMGAAVYLSQRKGPR